MTGKTMNITKAITLHLGNLPLPVVTSYELGKIVFEFYVSKKYQSETIKGLQKDTPQMPDYSRNIKRLLERGILSPNKNFPEKSVFNILGRKSTEAEEVICTVDPFCYVSHLSAMAHHGLTNREPQILFVSTPSPQDWSQFAKQKMAKDLKENLDAYIQSGLPKLTRIRCQKIQGRTLNKYSSKHLGAFKSIMDKQLRVSTIGRTFIDMVRVPKLCGGIRHVVECFENFAQEYSSLIISEAEQHANSIEKARLGYLLDEVCNIENDTLYEWAKHVERGGSRKLDPNSEYSPTYSEKWCLSINL